MAGGDNLQAGEIVSFGPFRLAAAERLLLKDGEPLAIGSRALDTLIGLVERCGEVVSRRELIARVWPGLVVEEANLRVHIGSLRKLLGDGQDGARYISNIPGRGYCFVAPVQRTTAASPSPQPSAPAMPAPAAMPSSLKLPARLARMVGREETVAALSALLASRRFVSVVGPGGMGKTTVAVSVAHALLDDFGDAVFFVDLGALTDAALVTTAVASALGLFSQSQDPLAGLLAFLAGKRLLLVIDNCEHVIEAAAALTERLFSDAPQVHLLTTSRESLRVEGEHIHLLRPLESPADGAELSAALALRSPSVQLFMERAAASGHHAELSDTDVPAVVSICRRLDGIALAIELAASRVGAYGIQGTAELLNNRFGLLWQGRRSALPRHQTLHAMLDWSYNLLSERDRRVMCRLSVFVGIFTLEAAQAVAADAEIDPADIADALGSLLDKSLIWTSSIGRSTYHRLPDTTRAYASDKLAESEDGDLAAMRHALYYSGRLGPQAADASSGEVQDWSGWARHMSNVRAALEWSFSPLGDRAIGVDLAARSAPLFLGLSLLGECQRWCEQGLLALDASDRGAKKELALQEALAISSMFTRGNGEKVRTAIDRGLHLAETLGEVQHHLHLLAGLHIFLTRLGDFLGAVAVAERSVAIAKAVGTPGAMAMADWMLGCACHLVGDHEGAQRNCELGFKRAAVSGPAHLDFFGYDHRLRALIVLARALWLRGFPDRAARTAHQAIDEAERRDHPVNLCIALIYTITVFLWIGDLELAQERIAQLIAHAAKHSLWPYHAVGLALQGELAIVNGQAVAGVALLRGALAAMEAEQHHILTPGFYRALAEGLVQCGELAEASAAIEAGLARAGQMGGTLDLPGLLRARGEVLLASAPPDLPEAEKALMLSLEAARGQSALGMELRSAMVLAKMWQGQARTSEAREMLAGIHRRFTEGFPTVDLKAAEHLLARLGHVFSAPRAALDPALD
jgi:predicted ATPase/DNA-binding winged helix-turn-helix (wHTH) protein